MGVAPSSPGAKAGLARGDQVIDLDGKPSKEFTLDEMRKAIRLDGKRQVTVMRDGKRVKLLMELTGGIAGRESLMAPVAGAGSPTRAAAPRLAGRQALGPRRLEDAGRDLAAHSLAEGAAGDRRAWRRPRGTAPRPRSRALRSPRRTAARGAPRRGATTRRGSRGSAAGDPPPPAVCRPRRHPSRIPRRPRGTASCRRPPRGSRPRCGGRATPRLPSTTGERPSPSATPSHSGRWRTGWRPGRWRRRSGRRQWWRTGPT